MPIADFTRAEVAIVQTTCNQRWRGEAVDLHPADVEMTLDPESDARIRCPALFWQVGDCCFVITKTGDRRYRCNFLYQHELEQYGTGVDDYHDLGECAVALLRVQADHDSVRSGAFPNADQIS